MSKPINRRTVVVIAGLAILAGLMATPASAQNTRSFVSGHGNDANPCSLAQPCRSFAAAVSATALNGEIVALDSAGYGPVVITQAVSIVAPPGINASITGASGGNAIGVAANNGGTVSLRGLVLEGGKVANDGIFYLGGDRLEIVDCIVRNFVHDGINLNVGNGLSGIKTMSVSNTISSDNGAAGIDVDPQSFFALRGVLDHVTTNANGQSGISVNGSNATNGGFVDVVISDSISDSNGPNGIGVQGLGNVKVEIKNSTMSNNVTNGLAVANAKVGISTNLIVLNGAGFSNTSSGVITTFGDNIIENNRDPNTGSLTPASRQ